MPFATSFIVEKVRETSAGLATEGQPKNGIAKLAALPVYGVNSEIVSAVFSPVLGQRAFFLF